MIPYKLQIIKNTDTPIDIELTKDEQYPHVLIAKQFPISLFFDFYYMQNLLSRPNQVDQYLYHFFGKDINIKYQFETTGTNPFVTDLSNNEAIRQMIYFHGKFNYEIEISNLVEYKKEYSTHRKEFISKLYSIGFLTADDDDIENINIVEIYKELPILINKIDRENDSIGNYLRLRNDMDNLNIQKSKLLNENNFINAQMAQIKKKTSFTVSKEELSKLELHDLLLTLDSHIDHILSESEIAEIISFKDIITTFLAEHYTNDGANIALSHEDKKIFKQLFQYKKRFKEIGILLHDINNEIKILDMALIEDFKHLNTTNYSKASLDDITKTLHEKRIATGALREMVDGVSKFNNTFNNKREIESKISEMDREIKLIDKQYQQFVKNLGQVKYENMNKSFSFSPISNLNFKLLFLLYKFQNQKIHTNKYIDINYFLLANKDDTILLEIYNSIIEKYNLKVKIIIW